jgi:hypothetical protein
MCFGLAMDYISPHVKGGGEAKRYHVCEKSDEDILMFGSSRMAHHYISKMIADSLGMTCYNCGEEGNGIIYCYGMFKKIIKRHTPKVIIYDVSDYDVRKDDHTKYIRLLKPHASDPDIREFIVQVSPNERLKLYSNLYRYNSTCISLLGGMVGMPVCEGGFEPLSGTMDYEPEVTPSKDKSTEIDPFKEKCLRQMIEVCLDKHIQLIFTLSPSYSGGESRSAYIISTKELCKEYGVPFVDCIGLANVSDHREYFKDTIHLNATGAKVFTDSLITRIRPFISKSILHK